MACREWWAKDLQVIASESPERVIGPATACRRCAVEETVKTRRRDEDEEADGSLAAPLPCV